jgi:hypothetical protein
VKKARPSAGLALVFPGNTRAILMLYILYRSSQRRRRMTALLQGPRQGEPSPLSAPSGGPRNKGVKRAAKRPRFTYPALVAGWNNRIYHTSNIAKNNYKSLSDFRYKKKAI